MGRREDVATIAHVLDRIAYGRRRSDWERVEELGAEDYIREQIAPDRIDDSEVDRKLADLPSLTMDLGELYENYPPPQLALRRLMREDEEPDEELRRQLQRQASTPLREIAAARIVRGIESKRQLTEVLTDFWYNHFNVFGNNGQNRYLVSTYERDTIRPHVLGNFREMLYSVARSPAMLVYLDNWRSAAEEDRKVAGPAPRALNDAVEDAIRQMQRRMSAGRMNDFQRQRVEQRMRQAQQQAQRRGNRNRPPGLNENYARELMELHTLGVDGGYTQNDVREVARALTGWTLALPTARSSQYGFRFRPDWHDAEEKTILGATFPKERGIEDGEQVLDMLAKHPSTATFIATKLARKFVADDPPGDLVDRVAGTFMRTNGHLPEVMRTLLLSDEFLGHDYRGAKVKSPLEFLLSTARALEVPADTSARLGQTLRVLGEPLYGASPPTGYPDSAEEWTSANAILARMQVGEQIANAVFRGQRGGRGGFGGRGGRRDGGQRGRERGPTGTVAQRTDVLLATILRGRPTDDLRGKILAWADSQPEAPGNAQIATLILGSPEFQRR